jgi:hypothetical protein
MMQVKFGYFFESSDRRLLNGSLLSHSTLLYTIVGGYSRLSYGALARHSARARTLWNSIKRSGASQQACLHSANQQWKFAGTLGLRRNDGISLSFTTQNDNECDQSIGNEHQSAFYH